MIERLIQLVIEILKQLFGIDDKNYNWNSTIENGEETQNISGTNETREIGEQGENKVGADTIDRKTNTISYRDTKTVIWYR